MLNMRPFPRDYQPLGLALAPASPADRDKLVEALQHITREDPSCAPLIDAETGLVRLLVKSEAHIAAIVEALFGAGVVTKSGVPQVSYREMPTVTAEVDYTHEYRSVTSSEFARVKMLFERNPRSMNNTFLNAAPPESVPSHFLPAIEQGLRSVTACGPLKGYPVMACRVTLLDGAHNTDSSPAAFEVAARAAFLDAGPKTEMKLFEPMLQTEITAPEDVVGVVVGDFNARRGVCNSKEFSPGVIRLSGFAPLANMLGYDASLKAIAGPTATYDWKLAGLEEVRSNIS